VQNLVGASGHAFEPDLAIGGVQQRQHLGRAVTKVFMRLLGRLSLRLPLLARVRYGLERARLIAASHGKPQRCGQRVGLLDQLFLGRASGSVTTTAPALRLRTAWPVGHHERVRWKV